MYLLPTGMQAHFMGHLEKHWTPTPGSGIRRRMCHLEIELRIKFLIYFT